MPFQRAKFFVLASLLVVTGLNVCRADNGPNPPAGTSAPVATPVREAKQGSFAARAKESFTKIIHQNFEKWDENRDGQVSADEIARLIPDPEVKGLEAAAAAAIHRYLRSDGAPSSVTQADLLATAQEQPVLPEPENKQEALRQDLSGGKPRFVTFYARFAQHLKKAPRDLFASEDGPTLEGVRQGALGDCFYMCVIGATLNRDPQTIRKMLRANPDGTTDVMFPAVKRVRVPPLTDGEIALTSSAADQGIWINVLEKAFGTVKYANPKNQRSEDDLDLDVISRGGKILTTIQLMTGHKAFVIRIRKYKNKKALPPTEEEIPRTTKRLDSAFTKAFATNRLVCADIAPGVRGKDIPPGLVGKHAYAILGYDPESQMVTVWNPHGKNYTPKASPPSPEHGYPVKNGVFQVPLDDFVRIFKEVTYETSAPLPRA
ncbi:MAG TPA: C2 family cysteine protease [Planctomycetaceae bacterium]|jgi:hypothetical protein|nr:C2 family cysteine protease [Planctomycetaceae bacterium]